MTLEVLAAGETLATLLDLANVRAGILPARYSHAGRARRRRAIAAVQSGGGRDPPAATLLGQIRHRLGSRCAGRTLRMGRITAKADGGTAPCTATAHVPRANARGAGERHGT